MHVNGLSLPKPIRRIDGGMYCDFLPGFKKRIRGRKCDIPTGRQRVIGAKMLGRDCYWIKRTPTYRPGSRGNLVSIIAARRKTRNGIRVGLKSEVLSKSFCVSKLELEINCRM